jgi:hypothetical protein
MRRFHIQRTEEDADEGAVKIARAELAALYEAAARDPEFQREQAEMNAAWDCTAGDGLDDPVPDDAPPHPWTCDPCGSTNVVDRGNCAFCGKPR